MQVELISSELFEKWIAFSSNKSIVECEFFQIEPGRAGALLGHFAITRLAAFGEHASGSLLSFYSSTQTASSSDTPVAWLDSKGAPCIVVSKNLQQFLSVLPYGPDLIYTVAGVIENNLDEDNILIKAYNRLGKSSTDLLNYAKSRFVGVDILIEWLTANEVAVSPDPIADIIQAHSQHDDLSRWIAANLS